MTIVNIILNITTIIIIIMVNLEKMRPDMERIIPKRASSGPLWTRV